MICNYSKCSKEAGRNHLDLISLYCSNKCRRLHTKMVGNDIGTDMEKEATENNRKLLSTALTGNKKSIKALQEQGLTYHWTRDSEWGEERSEL